VWVVTHTYVGLALGAVLYGALDWPWWLVAVIVVASHPVLDLVPHWDYVFTGNKVLWGAVDFGVALVTCLALLAAGVPFALVILGPLSGAPDFDVLTNTLTGSHLRHWFPSHWDRFPHGACGKPFGIGVQAALMAASVVVFAAVWP
jgi:hypothetical protein